MLPDDICNTRLYQQQILKHDFSSPKEVVSWMGAMQAQDFSMSKIGIGLRMTNATEALINAAIDNADIIRMHVLRPTWHLVSSDDIYWILSLSAPKIKSSLPYRHRQLGLTDEIISLSNSIIENALKDEPYLSRDSLVEHLQKSNIPVDENRASHLLLCAELDGIICSSVTKANKQTYALLQKWVPNKKQISKEEALALLVRKYFSSHGPATIQDFCWWSGMSNAEAKKGIELNKGILFSEKIGSEHYWFSNNIPKVPSNSENLVFLPAYDEYIISYKNRENLFFGVDMKKAISMNGIFKPVILIDGKVIGLWSRKIVKDKVTIEAELYHKEQFKYHDLLEKAAKRIGEFLVKEVDFRVK